MPPQANRTAQLARMALLSAIALTIFMVEAQLPVLVPIQGIKLGLANIVTLYTVFTMGASPALFVLVVRVILGAVFAGQPLTILYSLAGGILAWLATVVLKQIFTKEELWICSPLAAVVHNIGQLLMAAWVMQTWTVMAFLPYLVLSAIVTGLFTGLAAQALMGRLDESKR